MHTIESLYAQSIVDERISRAAAARAARESARRAPRRMKLNLHLRRPRRAAVPSV